MQVEEDNEEEEGNDEEKNEAVGRKRPGRRSIGECSKRRSFVMDGACCDDSTDDDDDDVDDDDDDDQYDVQGLIDDSDDVLENEPSFYRAINNHPMPRSSATPSIEPATTSTNLQKIEHQQIINLKKYKKEKALLKNLMTYISQLIILGFNSQKYDIPLIRNYLAPSLIKLDNVPKFVIKKMGAYMAISTSKRKFLDITNYLAAGISRAKFYSSYLR